MRYFLLMGLLSFITACNDGRESHFDSISISDPKVEICKKVKPLVIFGKSTCPFCQTAINAAKAREFDYRFVELDPQNSGKSSAELIAENDELKKMLEEDSIDPQSLTTVPQIFSGSAYVGGFDKFKEKLLDPIDELLGAANVAKAVRECRQASH